MSTPHHSPDPSPADPQDLDFDADALRARYRSERERRIRPEGGRQYQRFTGRFGYYDEDPYAEAAAPRPPLDDRVDVVVVGGGFGGLLAGARLRQAGVESIRVIEKGGDFGGTWYWNRYPGIHCDIESYIYMPLLEEVGYVPRWKYAPGEEIRQHAKAIGETFDLYRDAVFQTQVTELHWDEEQSEWQVGTDRGDRIRARYVVTASGTLSEAKLPGIPGIETFQGHTFHTSRWDYAYTGGDADGDLHRLADKRVALIGTGATAIQCVPHLGADAEQLYVFQRTPSSVDVRGNRPTDPDWSASLTPGWQRRRRDNFLHLVTGGQVDEDLVDDGWTSSARLQQKLIPSDSYRDTLPQEERERAYELADFQKMNELRARVDTIVTDPATADKLKPWYRYMCKRPTFSDSYLQAFNRPNVTLVDTADFHGVEEITENAVVVGGVAYEVDCIIFGTGFEAGVSGITSGRLPVHGRGGVTLTEAWKEGPRTLHGFYSHGFPNLFQLGPLQNASAVNFVHVLDEQATHVAEVVARAQKRAGYVEPAAEAESAWLATIRESAVDLYSFHAECTPGYYNNEGMPRQGSGSYGNGPVAFHALLRDWRANGGMSEVLVDADQDRA